MDPNDLRRANMTHSELMEVRVTSIFSCLNHLLMSQCKWICVPILSSKECLMQYQKNYPSKLPVVILICFRVTLISTGALNEVVSFEKL